MPWSHMLGPWMRNNQPWSQIRSQWIFSFHQFSLCMFGWCMSLIVDHFWSFQGKHLTLHDLHTSSCQILRGWCCGVPWQVVNISRSRLDWTKSTDWALRPKKNRLAVGFKRGYENHQTFPFLFLFVILQNTMVKMDELTNYRHWTATFGTKKGQVENEWIRVRWPNVCGWCLRICSTRSCDADHWTVGVQPLPCWAAWSRWGCGWWPATSI